MKKVLKFIKKELTQEYNSYYFSDGNQQYIWITKSRKDLIQNCSYSCNFVEDSKWNNIIAIKNVRLVLIE